MKHHVLFIHGAGDGAYEEDQLLAESLQKALGSDSKVHYPRMPEEDSATYADWKAAVKGALAKLEGDVVLVGHSVGGSVLAKYLSEARSSKRVAALFLLAAPFWNGEGIWTWEEARLSEDAAEKLKNIPHIFLYHSRDDEIVPFKHLALYTPCFPQAIIRAVEGRGHQFGNDLTDVADDVLKTTAQSPP